MPAYVIVEVRVTNPDPYAAYRDLATASVARHGGRFLVRGGAVTPLEDDWRPERFVVSALTKTDRPFHGHNEARLTGKLERAKLSVQRGALFIPANQRLARLAFYLLEPESDDGLVTWNLIEEGLTPGGTYPVYRVMNASPLKLAN